VRPAAAGVEDGIAAEPDEPVTTPAAPVLTVLRRLPLDFG
jgi:hypothetical protein